jgi:hypothetical protein
MGRLGFQVLPGRPLRPVLELMIKREGRFRMIKGHNALLFTSLSALHRDTDFTIMVLKNERRTTNP